jgi:hypothetical protein
MDIDRNCGAGVYPVSGTVATGAYKKNNLHNLHG